MSIQKPRLKYLNQRMTLVTKSKRPKKFLAWLLFVGVGFVLVFVFPLFHIVKLGEDGKRLPDPLALVGFEAKVFAAKFWDSELSDAIAKAQDLRPVLEALLKDPVAAADQFGKRVGLGSKAYYFLKGEGRVVEMEGSQVLLEVEGGKDVRIAVGVGPVFGNAIRDGCGLLDLNEFPGLEEFNAVSAELNLLVEERVLVGLKKEVKLGVRIAFVGCSTAPGKLMAGKPALVFVPLRAALLP